MERQAHSAIPAEYSVKDGRDAYLRENGFTVAAYDDKWTQASVFGLKFQVPNTAAHRRAIMWHDLHHVATAYGTDLPGEAEVSAWELRRGLKGLDLYVSSIVVGAVIAGMFLAPRRTLQAYRAAAAQPGRNLFALELTEYDATLGDSVAALREKLGVPHGGLACSHKLHTFAPATDVTERAATA
jgi:hypothetical protein